MGVSSVSPKASINIKHLSYSPQSVLPLLKVSLSVALGQGRQRWGGDGIDRPITGQYLGHMICLNQRMRSVSKSRDPSRPIRG